MPSITRPITRRNAVLGGLVAVSGAGLASQAVSGCAGEAAGSAAGVTQVAVIGAIHGRHRTSERFSLTVLERAVRAFEPDIILTEIPPDRIEEAKSSFADTGEVTEPRTRLFPELTDVVFPLSAELGFQIAACAGWTQAIADNRSAALKAIENDPARASQWAEHRAARAQYSQELAGRADDPLFIHSLEYDAHVQRAQTPYQIYFDRDLGPGGWTKINAAHTDLINQALDTLRGQRMRALVIFGAWHKYAIERSLSFRDDIERMEARG
ncbi:MAG: hypothetical protein AAFY19_10955, partial [Pseudomonadota bacterium]